MNEIQQQLQVLKLVSRDEQQYNRALSDYKQEKIILNIIWRLLKQGILFGGYIMLQYDVLNSILPI